MCRFLSPSIVSRLGRWTEVDKKTLTYLSFNFKTRSTCQFQWCGLWYSTRFDNPLLPSWHFVDGAPCDIRPSPPNNHTRCPIFFTSWIILHALEPHVMIFVKEKTILRHIFFQNSNTSLPGPFKQAGKGRVKIEQSVKASGNLHRSWRCDLFTALDLWSVEIWNLLLSNSFIMSAFSCAAYTPFDIPHWFAGFPS